jgi:CubicO group peptidase (beta-lactamase class C family)
MLIRSHVFRNFLSALLILSVLNAAASLPRDKDSIDARISRVENGLLPPNVIKGKPLPRMKLSDRMKHWNKVPGVSIAIINDYRIEWARGYGVLGEGSVEAVTPGTLFQAGSISKPVTAMAVLRLVQQGKLSLDEDVNKKLVSWKVPENEFTRDEKVTVRRLLSHTAGLNPTSSGDYPVGTEAPTLLQVLEGRKPANTEPVRVISVPGGRTAYSGSHYFVLQQLLIDVTGKPFPRLMEELVLRPLGMRDSTFDQPPPQALQRRAAAGKQGGEPVPGKWHIKPEMAAAGLWSTPSDLARFAIEIQKSRRGRSNRVLSREMTNLMLSAPTVQGDGAGQGGVMGLGLEIKSEGGLLRFSHGGYTTGYRCQMTAFEDGRGVVVMTNGSSQALLREIIWGVAREYGWPAGSLPKERVLANLAPGLLEQYAGQYENPPGRRPSVSTVAVKDNQLYLDGMPLLPESESSFFGETEATYVFVTDDKGQVSELIYDYGFAKFTARKVK